MPVKRRQPKRRLTTEAELEAWSGYFATGFDFFDDLPEVGLQATPDAAREAWARLGETFLAAQPANASGLPFWALEQFGPPQGGAHAR